MQSYPQRTSTTTPTEPKKKPCHITNPSFNPFFTGGGQLNLPRGALPGHRRLRRGHHQLPHAPRHRLHHHHLPLAQVGPPFILLQEKLIKWIFAGYEQSTGRTCCRSGHLGCSHFSHTNTSSSCHVSSVYRDICILHISLCTCDPCVGSPGGFRPLVSPAINVS